MTQAEALNILKTGANVFLTGPAGSGKTHVLRDYLACVRERDIAVGVTASTGIAATHMGGTTIHSWSGIGIKDQLSEEDIEEIADRDYIRRNVERAKILIIDEISMMHDFRLDMVDQVTQHIRRSAEPFGGLQVVLCGDFFQLPPISRRGERPAQFVYHSVAWDNLDLAVCYLEEQFRQNDLHYLRVLNAIRTGTVPDDVLEILKSRFGVEATVNVQPTRLYSHNVDVDAENEQELGKISSSVFQYIMQTSGKKPLIEGLKKSCLAPEVLRLKKGAQVMFVKNNFEKGYANGTLGVVVDCTFNSILVQVGDGRRILVERESWSIMENNRILAQLEQYPLRLAWAITIHKSQGMSLDAAQIDLTQSFEKGMGYVALSRVRSLAGLSLKGLNEKALQIHEEALKWDGIFRERSKCQSEALLYVTPAEMKQRHISFLGPDPSPEEIHARKAVGKKAKIKKPKIDSKQLTKDLISSGKTILEVATERGMVFSTIVGHIEELKDLDPAWNISHLRVSIPATRFQKIAAAFHRVGVQEGGGRPLTPVKQALGNSFSFEEIRLVRLFL